MIEDVLSEHGDLHVALLMGSWVTGRLRPDSDLDVAVSTGRPMTTEERMGLTESLAKATHRPIDLIDLETAHGLILKQALRMGKPLTLSRPATFERLLKRMIYEQEDLNPQIQHAKKSRVESFTHGY